jgi:two-component system phosphate regulon response regulator PhoB
MNFNEVNVVSGKSNPNEKTILIVDDDESICTFLKILLEKEGFKIETAYKGDTAVKVVESKRIDLIILDWMMPILSGFEVLKMLQSDEHRKIPVIVITARVTDRNTIMMIKQEMNVVDFFTKPIQHILFATRIHQLLNTLSPEDKKVQERIKNKPDGSRF